MTNWVLVPVRNGVQLTKKAMATFLRQDVGDVRVLVIDNDSQDGTWEWVRSLCPSVVGVRKQPGLSVAQSWNCGLRWLFQFGDKVLVVNNDVELRLDTYRLLDEDGGGFVTAVGTDDHGKLEGEVSPQSTRPHPDFSCFLIRKWVWEQVGEFDEKFIGAYGEDADYHLRMHRGGIDAHCIGVPFYHVACGTLKIMTDPVEIGELHGKADANRKYFIEKYGFEIGTDGYYKAFGHGRPDESTKT